MADPQATQAAPTGPTPQQVLNDGKFWALPDADRSSVLAHVDPNFANLADDDKQSVLTHAQQAYQQKHAGEATISASKPLTLSDQIAGRPGSWLDQAERDITQGARPGYDRTVVGRVAHALGLPRTGTAPDTSMNGVDQFMGRIPAVPMDAAKAIGELVTGHPVKAVNKAVQTLSDTGPAGILLAPEASLPTMIPTVLAGMGAQKLATKAADAAGVTDEDYRELAGNVGGIVGGGLIHGRLNPKVASETAPSVPLARRLGRLVGRGGAATTDAVVRTAADVAPTVAKVGVGAAALAADQAAKFGTGVAEGAGGYVNEKYIQPTVEDVKTSLADAVHQAVTNPSDKGTFTDITNAVKEHAGNAADLVQKAPDIAKSILNKIQSKAETPQEVTSNLVDKAVGHTVDEHWLHPDDQAQQVVTEANAKAKPLTQWGPGVSDAFNQVSGLISNAVRSAKEFPEHAGPIGEALKQRATETMGTAGEVGAGIQKKLVNLALDEYNRWTNPTVSGGSFDADSLPEPKFRRGTMSTNNPQAVGPTVSSDGIPRVAVNDEVGVGPNNQPNRTPLADLAEQEPWAKHLSDGFTAGMKLGGKVEQADLRFRSTPGLGNEYTGKNEVFNDRLTEMYGKAAVDPSLSGRAREIFSNAQEQAVKSGKANPGAVASQIENGLRQPGWFVDKNPAGTISTDSTPRMSLVQQALDQAAKHTETTSKFQSVTSAATSLGMGGVSAEIGKQISPFMGGAVGSIVGGLGLDVAMKAALKKVFVDPNEGVLKTKLMSKLADAPVFDSQAAANFKNAANQVAAGNKDPLAWTKTDSFNHLSPAEKVSAMKFADYSKRWFSSIRSLISKPEPLKVPQGQAAPARVYNTADNKQKPNLGNMASILGGEEQA